MYGKQIEGLNLNLLFSQISETHTHKLTSIIADEVTHALWPQRR